MTVSELVGTLQAYPDEMNQLIEKYLREWEHGLAEPPDLVEGLTLEMIREVILDLLRYCKVSEE
jgi:hypothetical protein